jgi:hypothetical protein
MFTKETLFNVQLQSDDMDLMRNLSKPELHAYFNELTQEYGEGFARVAMKRMSSMLSKGHRYRVGASGTASDNFDVAQTKRGVFSEFVVVTKGKTKANFFIRMGYKGKLAKLFGYGKLPPEAPIKQWIADKGITLYEGGDEDRKVVSKVIQSKSKYGKPYTRFSKNKKPSDIALTLIRKHIAAYGSENNNWVGLFPSGQGRFDYVVYTIKQQGYFQRLLAATGDLMIVALIDYINTGSMSYTGRVFRQYEEA